MIYLGTGWWTPKEWRVKNNQQHSRMQITTPSQIYKHIWLSLWIKSWSWNLKLRLKGKQTSWCSGHTPEANSMNPEYMTDAQNVYEYIRITSSMKSDRRILLRGMGSSTSTWWPKSLPQVPPCLVQVSSSSWETVGPCSLLNSKVPQLVFSQAYV